MKKSAIFALCITIVIACSTSYFKSKERVDLTQEERTYLEKFFLYFMLKEAALYTSWIQTLNGHASLLSAQARNRNRQKDREFYNKLFPIEKKRKSLPDA